MVLGDLFIYNTGSGELFFEPDSTGATAQTQLADFNGAINLNNFEIYVTSIAIISSLKNINLNKIALDYYQRRRNFTGNFSLNYKIVIT